MFARRARFLTLALALPPALPALAQGPAQGGPPFVSVPGVDTPLGLFDLGGRLFFAENQPATGNEPWTSTYPDGPSFLLGDLNPGTDHGCHTGDPEALGPAALLAIEFGARVLFSTHAGVGGQGEGDLLNLWISDGTVAGTQLLRTFDKPGGTYNYGYKIDGVSLGEVVVFNAYTDTDGYALWRTDGTPEGTLQLLRMDNAPYGFARAGNSALFAGPNLAFEWLLWRTDGTLQGTKAVREVVVDVAYPARSATLNGALYFAGRALGSSDTELWKSDGTFSGTVRVKDIRPGAEGSEPENLVRVGERLYFSADDGVSGRELWSTDGTEAGTLRLSDLNPGLTDSNLEELTESSGRLFFHAAVGGKARVYRYDEAGGPLELGVFEGVSSGPFNKYDFIHDMVAIGTRRVLFSARDSSGIGDELWSTDGTLAGTRLYAEFAPGSSYGDPDSTLLANGQIFVRANTGLSFLSKTLLAAPGGATADPIGQPCAASGDLPLLSASDPVLGQTTELAVRGARPQRPVLILRGAPAPASDLGFGCTTYLDLGTLSLLAAGTTNAAGQFDLGSIPIPADPALNGLRTTLQAVVGPTPTQPLGLDLSNAVLMTLGH